VNTKSKIHKKIIVCSTCSKEFVPTGSTSKFCSVNCRNVAARAIKYPNLATKVCIGCNCSMAAMNPRQEYCTTQCKVKHKSELKYSGIEGVDYLVCPICKIRTRQFTPDHAKMHGYTSIKEMANALGITEVTCSNKKSLSAGDKNPGYQHNGKFSAWSKNFIKGYNKEHHAAKNKIQSEMVRSNREKFKNNLEYWLVQTNGNVDEATKLYKKSQTRDLKYFVDKYGEVDGTKKHKEKIDKWQKTLLNKSIEELADINARKVRKSKCFYSAAEKELFNTLKEHFAELTDQFAIARDNTKRFYLYDMKLGNKIIEYNGDFWHANPLKFDEHFVNPYTKKTQAEIIARDIEKHNVAKNAGFDIFVVWENDYKENKQEMIQQCINFLTK